ncbi:polysaccharide biosynthesis tyrosine autokinase [Paracrocinitomix mangrovi]|uniref:polysaccharide biosynthesis tyrosine autokinase n=1 Tax=Paracrocinitomix mangrovi TaxID=2862509 RepID=UPI001C8E7F0E|nr:tyrosine-protein kinase [Paracrocinitomix mangrovi]UKN01558.1 polysaccharide biosynthesis tyrosine autokinase [Paracrocinitomix mangrovi]
MAETPHKSNKLIDSNDLMFVWKLFAKNILILIFVPILAYLVGYVYTHRLSNIYGAKAQLLLKSNETYDYQDPIYKGLGAYGVYMDVQNQMRILRSKDLIGEVIDKIDIGTSYYVVGRLKKQEVFGTLPFIVEVDVINPLIYEQAVEVEVIDKNSYLLNYNVRENEFSIEGKFDQPLITDDFRLNLKKQYEFNDNNIGTIMSSDYEVIFHSRNYLISKFQSSLKIENIEHTSILDVYVTDELQYRAKVFLDTLTSVYIDFSKRVQLEVNENTLMNIEKQIDTLQIFIEEKEMELLNYRDNNAILDPTKEGDQYFDEYIKYSQEKRELENQKSSIQALKVYLESTDDSRILPPSFYIEERDFYLQQAISEVRSLQVDLEISLTHSTEENAIIRNLKKEILMKKRDIIKYIENLKNALDDRIDSATQYIARYKYNVKSIPLSQQGISNIQRELDVNNKMYMFLLEKKTNTLIARAGIIPQVRILETTSMLGSIQPNKTKLKRLFILGGLIVAILIAFIRLLFFHKISNVHELKEVSSLNVIGGIPLDNKQGDDIVIDKNPKSQIAESFRSIRTNLSFLLDNQKKGNKILVSSYFPGEGKTFCSANLATLYSRAEKKTVILDFDLHKPKIHKMFDLENTNGISNYIIGKSNIEDIIRKDVGQNLDVVTAGPVSPNPSELVVKQRVNELIDHLSAQYDFVIIDTPPFGLLNDTMELSRHVDVFIVVLNSKYTRRRGVKLLENLLLKSEKTNFGLILNGIKESKLKYYYSKYAYKYTYGYSYGYGYGYSSEYGEKND